jgi:hypothetical protein
MVLERVGSAELFVIRPIYRDSVMRLECELTMRKYKFLFMTIPALRINAGNAIPPFGLFLTCREK